ncbi:MAG: HlyD family efflux transporter periplasmic adaptor subunit [Candidatus Moraniibacteriota bacterium]
MRKKTKIALILAVLAALGIAGYFLLRQNEKEGYITEKAERGDVEKNVSITGSIVSEKPVGLNFESPGRVKEIKISTGEEVAEGEIVAVLDDEILSKQLEKARLALEKALADSQTNKDKIREAEEKLDNSEDYLEAVEDHQEELVKAAELDYENAVAYYEDTLDYYNEIVEESGENSSVAKKAKSSLTQAENSKEKAKQALKISKKSKNLNVVSAENSVDLAEESLESVESDYASKSRDSSVQSARANYEIAKKKMEDASLKSPVNGVVSKINYEEGEVVGNSAMENFGEVITKDYIVEADIPESDISEISMGQKARVNLDAFSDDKELDAEVIDIDPASTVVQDVVYYKTRLKFNADKFNIKEGMTADIEILMDKSNNVIKIPERATREKEGSIFVDVFDENRNIVERKIVTGLDGDQGYVEIKEGLKEGEEVILSKKEQ